MGKKDRYLPDVISRLRAEIPHNEHDIQCRLESIRQSALVSAPENMHVWWRETCDALAEELGEEEPFEGWKVRVGQIIRGER